MQTANKELKIEILKAKQRYKCELENKVAANNMGSAWCSMKTIAGLQEANDSSCVTLDVSSSDTKFEK